MSANPVSDGERRSPASFSRRLALLAIAGLWLTVTGAIAQSANVPTVQLADGSGGTVEASANALIAKAEAQGRIPVIVELRLDSGAELGANAGPGQLAAHRAAIASLQRRVVANVPGAQSVKRYVNVPYMAMSIGPAGARALLGNDMVAAIDEDARVEPLLDVSVPLIRADVVAKRKAVNGGKGWTVVVIDSGVQLTHPALRGRIVSEACFSTNDSSQGASSLCPNKAAQSFAKGSGKNCPASLDGCFHGTHVAGIALGNPANKYKGVAPNANLISMQVFSRFTPAACGRSTPCISAFYSDIIGTLDRSLTLTSSHKIASVNMSLGGGAYTQACNNANASLSAITRLIRQLGNKGVAVVIASGNNGSSSYISAPGCISNAVTVGSTTKSDQISSFSNHNRLVDLMAPGSDITSAILGSKYGSASGTSMATPHVAGAWALMKKIKPNATVAEIQKAFQCTGKRVVRAGIAKRRIDVEAAANALINGC
jgi:subtilisin family serine protease